MFDIEMCARFVIDQFLSMFRLMDLKPIIALPYNPKKWNARQAIQILDASNSLGFEECIWQLGSGN